jgi:di/tricarboxylate transporter
LTGLSLKNSLNSLVEIMNFEIAVVLGLLVLAIVLFASQAISIDVTTLLLLICLVVSGILTPAEALGGLGSEIIVILGSIFVLTGALRETGVMEMIGGWLRQIAGNSPLRLLFSITVGVGAISGFVSNTAATAVFVPPVLGLSRSLRISASGLLMPMAFASIMGGTCTLIGTSTNVAVSGYLVRAGFKPIDLFEPLPLGLIVLGAGIIYLMLVGRRLLPIQPEESLSEEYAIREYLSEIVVMPDSTLVGQRIFASDLSRLGFQVLEVLRGTSVILPETRTIVEKNDILLVKGKVSDLMKVKETAGIEIRAELKLEDPKLRSGAVSIREAMISPQSDLIGRTLKEVNFRQSYGMTVLAIYRHGHSIRERIGRLRLRMGDLLLVQAPAERLLVDTPNLWFLEGPKLSLPRQRKGAYVVAFFVLSVTVGGLGWVPLSIAFLSGALLTVLFRCITVEEAYEFMDWKLLILVAGMSAFGVAMEKTGAANFVATSIVQMLEPLGSTTVLAGLMLLTVVLTQPMSNAAAALVMVPIALSTAQGLGVNPRAFAIAIMLTASISMIAPFEPACILVYGPGRYRFIDFVKVGSGLTLTLCTILLFLIPFFWPLHPLPQSP